MYLKRPAFRRIASTAVGVAALAGGLTLAAGPAHASTTVNTTFQLCDFLSNTSVGIDAWSGSNHLGLAGHNSCVTINATASGVSTAEFFLNGQVTAVQIGTASLDGNSFTVVFTGPIGNIQETFS